MKNINAFGNVWPMHWRKGLLLLTLSVLPLHAADVASTPTTTTTPSPSMAADAQAVQQLEGNIALVLAREGFDQYAGHFHADYSNWADTRPPRSREQFLSAVRSWYESGGRATAVNMQPVAIEVWDDLALSRYLLREDFADGSSFVGRFVSVARKSNGRWLLYRTSFNTLYYGDTSKAPGLASFNKT